MESMTPADGETVEVVEGVYLTQLVAGKRMSVQHFHIEPGASVPEHSHDYEQVGYVVHGIFIFTVNGTEHVISPGDSYHIPSNEVHGAENRADIPIDGIDVFGPPRTNPDWME